MLSLTSYDTAKPGHTPWASLVTACRCGHMSSVLPLMMLFGSPVTFDIWEVQLALVFVEAGQAVIQLLLELS